MNTLFSQNATSPYLIVEDEDGDPSASVYKIKFSNGSVTNNNDGTASVSSSGGASGSTIYVDSVSEIQTAIDTLEATSTGGTVRIKAGEYAINPGLTINSNGVPVTLEGDGFGTILKANGASIDVITIEGNSTTGWGVKNLLIEGNKFAVSGTRGIVVTSDVSGDCKGVIENVHIQFCKDEGFTMPSDIDTRGIYFQTVTVYGCDGTGFLIDGSDHRFTNCVASNNAKHGFYGTDSNTIFDHCSSSDNGDAGDDTTNYYAWYLGGAHSHLMNCQMQNNATFGVVVAGARSTLISGLQSEGNHEDTDETGNCADILVKSTAKNVNIIGNSLSGFQIDGTTPRQEIGIQVESGASEVVIGGNLYKGFSGSDTSFADNASNGDFRIDSNIRMISDAVKIYQGADDDSEIYHDGSNAYWNVDTGTTIIDNDQYGVNIDVPAYYGFHLYDAGEAIFDMHPDKTRDQMIFKVREGTGRQIIIGSDGTQDYDHATQTNPTLFGHSATAPDTANNEWWSLTHDQTDAKLTVGKGNLDIVATDLTLNGAAIGGGSPGGSTTEVQFNDAGVIAGDSDYTWDKTNNRLGIGGTAAYPLYIDNTIDSAGIYVKTATHQYFTGLTIEDTHATHIATRINMKGSRGGITVEEYFNDIKIFDSNASRYIYWADPDSAQMGDNDRTQDVWFFGQQVLNPTSPAQLTANVDNYSILSPWVRLTSDASRDITGIAENAQTNGETDDTDGAVIYITNVGAENIVLKHEDANSTATNRILSNTGADITLSANEIAMCIYDQTTGRWRCHEM
jgi:hypothetical protein